MRKLLASMMALVFIAAMSSGCTIRTTSTKSSFEHRHRHSHRGMPRHHIGNYHRIPRIHPHTHR